LFIPDAKGFSLAEGRAPIKVPEKKTLPSSPKVELNWST